MRIALFQMTAGIDPAENARALRRAIVQAADGRAQMLFTPEMSGLIDQDRARSEKVIRSEDENRPEIQALKAALTSEKTRAFIQTKYHGAVIPSF